MNTYETRFFATCPANGVRVEFTLAIETNQFVRVEKILEVVGAVGSDYHEAIAVALAGALPGRQTLVAHHHGVTITTVRGEK